MWKWTNGVEDLLENWRHHGHDSSYSKKFLGVMVGAYNKFHIANLGQRRALFVQSCDAIENAVACVEG